MQLAIYRDDSGESSDPEWVIVELQGELQSRSADSFEQKYIGNLLYTKEGTPILIIGHHILYGAIHKLDKPMAVMEKSEQKETNGSSSESNYYNIKTIIRKKILFNKLPKPIIANVPKTL